ncbi:hypothetical protein CDD82_6572 [Ophiocordyceps australis]|uniref:Formamidopyrimidine-DNA glycosylase H2TH DNA-binding domain-containing protein n=1 Tax=Ophiocordyceps australis TaxID=1399860 RepID=A0A2C5ZR08_9HYPO|nr:hypothetical protein CDD82_6572 [Ophiocordyceps australis]
MLMMGPGWLHIRGQRTAYSNYYSKLKDDELSAWPPRFCKFHVTTADSPPVQAAFTDVRRFARVYLVDGPAAAIRHLCPLAGRGPDPVVDTHVFTLQWFSAALRLRRIPVKAWLLDQQNISGIGNWVADEALFHARIHPEQQTNMLDDAAAQALYHAVCYVCRTAVSLLGDSDRFPDHWLFNHRWSKASKQPPSLPNGQALSFVTVAGRTSCYAPALQSKTSPSRTPSDCQSQPAPNLPPGGAPHPKRRFASSSSQSALIDPESDDTCKQPNAPAKTAVDDVGERLQAPSRSAKRTRASQPASKTDVSTGRRRSARLRT